jgi:peptidoglycan/xylan/chitin deacetylase (PgdA/CDA1 family)
MKQAIKQQIYKSTLGGLIRSARKKHITFGLCYHRFEEALGQDPIPGMAHPAEMFRWQLETLKELGRFVSIGEALQPQGDGIRFMLSFDDGYADNYTVALPILEDLEIPACFYITTDFVRGNMQHLPHDQQAGFTAPALTPDQLKKLARHKLATIGCHSATHKRLNDFWRKVWNEELVASDQWLEDTIGEEVMDFAYPYGGPEDLVWHSARRYLIETGYRSVASNFGGKNRAVSDDVYERDGKQLSHLHRVPMPVTMDRTALLGWTLGYANPIERFLPKRYLE